MYNICNVSIILISVLREFGIIKNAITVSQKLFLYIYLDLDIFTQLLTTKLY